MKSKGFAFHINTYSDHSYLQISCCRPAFHQTQTRANTDLANRAAKILLGRALGLYTSASARLICVLPCVFWTNTQLWGHFARTLISVIYQASAFHRVPHTPWQYLITLAHRKRSWFSQNLSNFPIFPLSNFPFPDPCSTSSHSSVLYM